MENLERKIKKKSIKVLDIYKEVVSLLNNQGLVTYSKSYSGWGLHNHHCH